MVVIGQLRDNPISICLTVLEANTIFDLIFDGFDTSWTWHRKRPAGVHHIIHRLFPRPKYNSLKQHDGWKKEWLFAYVLLSIYCLFLDAPPCSCGIISKIRQWWHDPAVKMTGFEVSSLM
jgi:hypothetical protein